MLHNQKIPDSKAPYSKTPYPRTPRSEALYCDTLQTQGGPSNVAAKPSTGITEVVLPEPAHLVAMLPTLAYLSQQAKDRWFTWFPPAGINKPLLAKYGFNLPHVRLVHIKSIEQQLYYTWEALAEGNSHAVVASLGKLSEKRLTQLESAAKTGNCSGLLIRYR